MYVYKKIKKIVIENFNIIKSLLFKGLLYCIIKYDF